MELWRKHWFDIGGVLAVLLSGWLYMHRAALSEIQLITGLSLVSLLLHQVEEYRWPGYFPGVVNVAMYRSDQPDRYPLNAQTALLVNVVVGWGSYALAALLAPAWPWLGIATMLVSAGNVLAHTLLFNLRAKTWYNPGMATALLLFAPLVAWYGHTVLTQHLASAGDWLLGVVLGLGLNYLGILKLIDWLADPYTPYHFASRQLRQIKPRA